MTRDAQTLIRARRWRQTGDLVHVEARHFVAGLIVHDGVCVDAAPILRWAIGKRWRYLDGYLRDCGHRVTLLA